jgi:hypothetical protein
MKKANRMSDEEQMELLNELYCNMEDEDKKDWSLEAAQELLDDQHTYEREHGLAEGDYDVNFWFEFIAELIESMDEM